MQKLRLTPFILLILSVTALICFGLGLSVLQQDNADEKFRGQLNQKLATVHQTATAQVVHQQRTFSAEYERSLELVAAQPPQYPKSVKYGLYEAKLTWTNKTEPNSYFEEKTDFVWVRLYKNGTYRTSQLTKGKIEGRYVYNSKTGEITFKNSYTEEDSLNKVGGHHIYNNLQALYDESGGSSFSWNVQTISYNMGEIYCRWKKT